jgi:tetratricopeptide (TPR) repeat protein
MNTNLNTNYLFKALDAYPFDLAETIEALNYALSYDENDVEALYLMAVLYAEQLRDYTKAEAYCEEVIAKQIDFSKVYPFYAFVLLSNEDFEKVQNVIDFGLKLKGSDKGMLIRYQGLLYERLAEFKKAIKALKKAKRMGLNNDFISFIDSEINRVKKKIKPKKTKKKKKKKKKGKSKKNA